MATSFRAGAKGKMTIDGTAIGVTKWTFKLDRSLQDTTSTSSYDSPTANTWQEQLPGVVRGEGSIDFNFDANSTSSVIIAKLKLDPVVAIVLSVDQTTVYATFNANISDVEMTLEVDGKVSGSANFKSSGVVAM